ncbi:MAG: hypothetical protein AB1599_08760 [Planctomycetota bacterium]
MNRNLLILIGLACAFVTAAGVMWYTPKRHYKHVHICYDYEVPPLILDDNAPAWTKEYFKEYHKEKTQEENK